MGARFKDGVDVRVKLNGTFALTGELEYYSMVVGAWIKVPAGEPTDFASVPWFARWLIPKTGLHNLAAIVHDYLYRNAKYTKSQADEIFREALKVLGVGSFKRNMMYAAVVVGGKGEY
jgi:hypothetical protein